MQEAVSRTPPSLPLLSRGGGLREPQSPGTAAAARDPAEATNLTRACLDGQAGATAKPLRDCHRGTLQGCRALQGIALVTPQPRERLPAATGAEDKRAREKVVSCRRTAAAQGAPVLGLLLQALAASSAASARWTGRRGLACQETVLNPGPGGRGAGHRATTIHAVSGRGVPMEE